MEKVIKNHHLDKTDMGNRLSKARKGKKLTQQKLVDIISGMGYELTLSAYKKWEIGENAIPVSYFPVLCSVLSIESGYLFGEYEEKKKVYSDISAITGLSACAVKKLMKYKNEEALYHDNPEYRVYTGCIEALSSLLESHVVDELLRRLFKVENQLSHLAELLDIEAEAKRECRMNAGEQRVIRTSNGRAYNCPDNYTDDYRIAHQNRVEFEEKEVDSQIYHFDTQFRYLLEELRKKAEEGRS